MSGAVFIANTVLLVALCFESIRVTRKELRNKRVLSSYLDKLNKLEVELQATLKARAELDSLRDRLKKSIEVADELNHSLKKQPPPLFPPPPNTHSFDIIAIGAADGADLPQDLFLDPLPSDSPLGMRPIDRKKSPLH